MQSWTGARGARQEITGKGDVCLTCSFQAEDVLLTKLAIERDPKLPILFLDTGYHFKETYEYRDRIARDWNLNLINLLPAKTVAEQEAEFGLLYQTAPDRCCGMRKVEPLFNALAGYRVWFTGLRREQAKSRAALEERAMFSLPAGKQMLKLAPLTEWTTRDVWYGVRAACDSVAVTVRARLHIHWLRAMHIASNRSERSTLRTLGGPQGGMRNSHSSSTSKVERPEQGQGYAVSHWVRHCVVHRAHRSGRRYHHGAHAGTFSQECLRR